MLYFVCNQEDIIKKIIGGNPNDNPGHYKEIGREQKT